VDEPVTTWQQVAFVAIVLNEVPLGTLVPGLAPSRRAIYKTLLDARPKLRAAFAAKGYIGDD